MYFKGLLERTDIPLDVKEAIRAGSSEIEDLRKRLGNLNLLQLRDMFDNTPIAVYVKDLNGRYILVNRQWCERTGIEEKNVLGKTTEELYPDYPIGAWLAPEKQVIESEKAIQIEEVGHTTGRIYLATKFLLRDSDGKAYALCNSSIDITERKKIQEALKESEEKYRRLIEQLEEGVLLENLEGLISFINPKMVSMLGYSEDEILGAYWTKFVPEDEYSNVIKETGKHHAVKSSVYETTLLAKDGSRIPVILSAAPVYSNNGKITGILCVFNDITERKRTEKLLQESERKYRNLVERANDGILIIIDGLVIFANERLASMADLTVDEVINTPFLNYVHPDHVSKVLDRYQRWLAGEDIPSLYETVLVKKDGVSITVEINADRITFEGKLADLVFVRDISERKRAEEMLIESRKLLRQVIDLVPQQIFAKGASGRFIFANEAVAAAYGTTVDGIVNTYQKDLHHSKEELEDFLASDRKVIDGKIPVFIPEESFTDYNGVTHKIQTLKIPFEVAESKEPAILGVANDITDLKEAENSLKLIKAEEERYHAMLSHFTRNELQKIVNNVDFVKLEYESSKLLNKEILDRIVSIADRSSKTMDNVNRIFEVLQMPFSPPSSPVNLLQIITQSIKRFISLDSLVEVDQNVSKVELFVDGYIKDVFKEIFSFMENYYKETAPLGSSISLTGLDMSTHYSLCIKENITPSIPEEIALSLSGKITDEWESQGHYVGIALVSVIMQHYGGEMRIRPLGENGNEFQLIFPKDLVNSIKEEY